MTPFEIRDPTEARRFLAQSLWLQRAAAPRASTVGPALWRALEIASGGEPVPPVGLVADVGHLVLDEGEARARRGMPEVPGWPAGLARAYEDLVLGKLDADPSIARASAALARYRGRDRDRGLAFLLDALRRRAAFPGVLLNPAAIKAALEGSAEELLAAGWDSLSRDGPMSPLPELYHGLIAAVRDSSEALGPEDVFELEHRTALAAFGQRVALRQVLQAAAEFEAGASRDRPRVVDRHQDVATHLLEEDVYPVGGFSSISTKGSIESLLHSQLVFMEPGDRPDLFDIKFVRDELLYYSRDENQFLRRRRTYIFALGPDLVLARVKDVGLPGQRIVLLIAVLVAAVRRLTDWLSDEAIVFEFLFLREGDAEPLADERELVAMILREAIANGTAVVESIAADRLLGRLASRARRSQTSGLIISRNERFIEPKCDGVTLARLRLDGPFPTLGIGDEPCAAPVAEDAPSCWRAVFERLLASWA